MLYDIILIGIIILFIVIGSFKGLARMVFGLAATFVSWLLASWIAAPAAGWLYNALIEASVKSSVAEAVQKLITGAANSVSEVIAQLPVWLKGAMDLTGEQLPSAGAELGNELAGTAADTVNTAVRPVIVGFITIILTVVLFFLIRLILRKLLMKPILGLFKLPVISTLNRILGAVLGAVEGLVVVCILAYLLRLLLPHIASGTGILNESTIYNSFIFYHFYSGNIFTYLTSWIS